MAGDDEEDEDEDEMEAPLSEEMEEFEGDDEGDVALDPRERAARSLEIRRAIEARQEERRMRHALDYLEVDDDDDEGGDEDD